MIIDIYVLTWTNVISAQRIVLTKMHVLPCMLFISSWALPLLIKNKPQVASLGVTTWSGNNNLVVFREDTQGCVNGIFYRDICF